MNAFGKYSVVDGGGTPSVAQSRSKWAGRGISLVMVSAVLLVTGLGNIVHADQATAATTPQPRASTFGVQFGDCSELAGSTTITGSAPSAIRYAAAIAIAGAVFRPIGS